MENKFFWGVRNDTRKEFLRDHINYLGYKLPDEYVKNIKKDGKKNEPNTWWIIRENDEPRLVIGNEEDGGPERDFYETYEITTDYDPSEGIAKLMEVNEPYYASDAGTPRSRSPIRRSRSPGRSRSRSPRSGGGKKKKRSKKSKRSKKNKK